MKKLIAILMNPDSTEPMNLFYNGSGKPMTAENAEMIEEIGYTPESPTDAMNAIEAMYGSWPWELEWKM